MKSIVAVVSLLVSAAYCSPAAHYAVHEKRQSLPHAWERLGRMPRDHVIDMKIALKENNLHLGDQWLDEVSNPSSSKYGQHWSAEEVMEAFKPSKEAINAVFEWLKQAGVQGHQLARGQNWVNFNATIAQVEELLKAEYSMHQHRDGALQLACDEYSLPLSVKDHIDFVLPSIHFNVATNGRPVFDKHGSEKRATSGVPVVSSNSKLPGLNLNNLPKTAPPLPFSNLLTELEQCVNRTTPNCLRALYTFTENYVANPKNSYGIVEYTPQTYNASDLDLFFRNYSTRAIGTRPITKLIDGAVVQQEDLSVDYIAESTLDLANAIALTYPIPVTLYQTGDLEMSAGFDNFLDALDASFCTYEGGDDPDPNVDAQYPDPLPGGYKGKDCGTITPAKVISTSYGYNEADLSPFYAQRQCNEYMKLGLMGTTFLFSSGDYGVAGNSGECLDQTTKQLNGMTTGAFAPGYPSTCPYVTAVGATQVIPGTNVLKARASGVEPEEACETVIYSGGGFSNVFPLPSYQKSAVTNWFKKYPPPYTAAQFNNSMTTRGFPDISANGANYPLYLDGRLYRLFGTSASSPVVGSLITLINNARLSAGKGSVGFINPVLYANPQVLNDITQGGNQGCGTPGFSSAPGWDPVTGLGTPNFPLLQALFLALP